MEAQTVTWLVFLALIKHVSTSNPIRPVKGPPTEPILSMQSEVTEGETIWVECTADSFPSSTLTLMRVDNTNPPPFMNNSFQFGIYSPPINTIYLEFNVTSSDAGLYICRAQNSEGSKDSEKKEFMVKYPPTEPILSIRSEVTEGQTITITCTAESFPQSTLTLMRININHQALIITENNLYSRPINTLSHKINVTSADAGQYLCRAKNTEGSKDSKKKELVVKYSPKHVKVQANPGLDVKENVLLTLSCTADSNPPVSFVTWRKTTDGREEIVQQVRTQTFTLNSASPSDSGLYSCEATNDIGRGISQPAEVKVRYKPRKTSISVGDQAKVGSSLTLTCDTDANPAPTTYSWYRIKNQRTDSRWRPTNRRMLHLTIQRADEACYRCSASNLLGREDESQPVCIQVLYPPTEPILSMRSEVTEGHNITVTCTVESFPQSTLNLMRINTNHQALIITKNNSRPINTLSHKIPVTSADAGLYICRAKNSEGSKDSKKKKLVVKFSPKHTHITESAEKQELDGRSSVMLSCLSHSFPPVHNYSWYRKSQGEENDEIVSVHQNHTVFSNQSGVYYCVAQNEVNQSLSDPVHLFEHTGNYLENLRFLVVALLLLMIITVIVVNLRYWRKSVQQGTTNTKSPSGFSNEPESLQDYENISNATAGAPTSPNVLDDHTSEGEVELNFPQLPQA